LKTLSNPPAIVFIETAAHNKSKRYRHAKIAEHYGLLNIDLQKKSVRAGKGKLRGRKYKSNAGLLLVVGKR